MSKISKNLRFFSRSFTLSLNSTFRYWKFECLIDLCSTCFTYCLFDTLLFWFRLHVYFVINYDFLSLFSHNLRKIKMSFVVNLCCALLTRTYFFFFLFDSFSYYYSGRFQCECSVCECIPNTHILLCMHGHSLDGMRSQCIHVFQLAYSLRFIPSLFRTCRLFRSHNHNFAMCLLSFIFFWAVALPKEVLHFFSLSSISVVVWLTIQNHNDNINIYACWLSPF